MVKSRTGWFTLIKTEKTINKMLEMLSYDFMQRAFIAGILIGILCALISFFVVLKRLSFIGVGISHSAFGGVALGTLINVNITFTALLFSLGMAGFTGFFSKKGKLKEDTAIGILFSVTMALGILFIGLAKGYNTELFGYLFGSILSVTNTDIWIILILGLLVISTIMLLFKEFLYISFDEEMAFVQGLPVNILYYLLLFLTALTIVISIKIVGIILISALIVIPGASAKMLCYNFRNMIFCSVFFSVFSVVTGLILSYFLNLASGATIVLISFLIFLFCFIISSKRRK